MSTIGYNIQHNNHPRNIKIGKKHPHNPEQHRTLLEKHTGLDVDCPYQRHDLLKSNRTKETHEKTAREKKHMRRRREKEHPRGSIAVGSLFS
jgi:hypothetical protein